MKKLSLSMLLFLLGTSNVQAISFSPVQWVKENKEKVAALTGVALGAAISLVYKERIAAIKEALSNNDFYKSFFYRCYYFFLMNQMQLFYPNGLNWTSINGKEQ